MSEQEELRVDGAAIVYRLYDVGYGIDLERAAALLAGQGPVRVLPARGEAQAIHIKNPPLSISLGERPLALDTVDAGRVRLSARLFDFGVCSLHVRVELPPGAPWVAFSELGAAVDASAELRALFDDERRELVARLAPAIEHPELAPVTEEYVVFRITGLTRDGGTPVDPSDLTDEQLVPLLLNERRPLSAGARRELLPHRFSYYAADLAVLTWDNALVVEPRPQDRDVEYVLEFANAQLLELRVYDALLDAELPAMYDRVAATRARRVPVPTRRFRPLLEELHTRVADITELVERVENALKVTDDVYLARIYAAALEQFRERSWRRGIDRKLQIMRETYAMLNAEAHSTRTELLEIAVVLLIVAELIVGLLRH